MKKYILLIVLIIVLLNAYEAFAVSYDGIWFMGFNLSKAFFQGDNGLNLRKTISLAVDKKKINREFGEEDAFPRSIVPRGMEGYDESSARGLQYNPASALKTLKAIKTDVLPAQLTLLHTDGLKTKAFAQYIKDDLARIGVKLLLVEIPYSQQEKWVNSMISGKYDMFLLGYKAIDYKKTETLLEPIFKTKGEANFMFFSDVDVDTKIDNLKKSTIKAAREDIIKKLNAYIVQKYVILPLFYIENF